MISCMIKKFLKQLDVDAHVIDQIALCFTKSDISNELKHPKVSFLR